MKASGFKLIQEEDLKDLGLHLDRILTWKKNVFVKRKQLGFTLVENYWLLARK
jgi:hypothetical protein